MNPNREAYDRISAEWAKARDRREIDPCIVDFAAGIPRGGAVLDIGCGTGAPIDVYLAKCGFAVTGIDFSREMIRRARQRALPRAQFLVCDLLEYEPDAPFDAAIAFDSIWHVEKERQREIYPRIARWLRPGGRLLFTHGRRDGSVKGEMFGATFEYSALDAAELREILNANGFEIETMLENYAHPITGTRDLLVTAKKRR